MTWLTRMAVTGVLVATCAAVAAADTWNDKTTIKFDAPVMIPGATLAPGSYTFKLMDSKTNRHIVQIFNADETKLIATANAIPIKRMEPRGDVAVKLNPTEAGAPVALKAWFYPGSLYGHEFVYSDRQGREIAQRTKTLVLSSDVPDGDMNKGTLYTYDAQGTRKDWQPDDAVMQEWEQWNRDRERTASARVVTPGTEATRESTAPMMRATQEGMSVSIGELEDNPNRHAGKTINVTAEVEEVLGPRLFKIDEPHWGDLDGEVLVYLPGNLAALVREGDRVTVTGTMKTLVSADLRRELGWLEPDPDVEVEFASRPALVASQVVGGNSNVALAIHVNSTGADGAEAAKAVGTSGGTTGGGRTPAVANATAIGGAGRDLVGRQVDLDAVKVDRAGKNHGFWVAAGEARVFVLPATHAGNDSHPKAGESVSIDGVVLEMPEAMREDARTSGNGNDDIYIYATSVD